VSLLRDTNTVSAGDEARAATQHVRNGSDLMQRQMQKVKNAMLQRCSFIER
jgi:hypothetical protein